MRRNVYRVVSWCRLAAARLRAYLLQLQGARLGAKCLIGRDVRFDRPWTIQLGTRCVVEPSVWLNVVADDARVVIGDNTFIGRATEIGAIHSVRIGRDVLIGPNVFITDHNHGTAVGIPMRSQPCASRPVVIDDDVWIGAGCIILAGVRIGPGAVVAAGAVVTAEVLAADIVAGVPARVIGHRGAQARSTNDPSGLK